MDASVALVESYLRVNGYFTATEWPIAENSGRRGYRTVTEIDVMGFRFAGAAPLSLGRIGESGGEIDPALGCPDDCHDMIIGEVKEGEATFNPGAHRNDVLQTVLRRFGCSDPAESKTIAETLIRDGKAMLQPGHQVRLVAFGSTTGERNEHPFLKISTAHIFDYLRTYLGDRWKVVRHVDLKDPVLDILGLMEKSDRA